MSYVGIEGSSYVGKTTVGLYLQEHGATLVPEYDTFGPFPVADETRDGLKFVLDELFDRERKRSDQLARITTESSVFSDRTPLSLVTFEDMRIASARDKDSASAHEWARDYALARIESGSATGDLLLPDMIAVLRLTTLDAFSARVQKRGVTPVTTLANFEMQQLVADRTVDYANKCIGEERTVEIAVDGLTVEEAAGALGAIALAPAFMDMERS